MERRRETLFSGQAASISREYGSCEVTTPHNPNGKVASVPGKGAVFSGPAAAAIGREYGACVGVSTNPNGKVNPVLLSKATLV